MSELKTIGKLRDFSQTISFADVLNLGRFDLGAAKEPLNLVTNLLRIFLLVCAKNHRGLDS